MEVGSGSGGDGGGGLVGLDFDFSSFSFFRSFSSDLTDLTSGLTISTILLSFPDFDDFEFVSDCTSVFRRTTSISVFEFFFLASRSEVRSESSARLEDLSSLGGLCILVSGLSYFGDL